jgi:hypothetical protein
MPSEDSCQNAEKELELKVQINKPLTIERAMIRKRVGDPFTKNSHNTIGANRGESIDGQSGISQETSFCGG